MMRVLIKVVHDSDNSFPTNELEFLFTPNCKTVSLRLTDSDRDIDVDKAELRRVLELIKLDDNQEGEE